MRAAPPRRKRLGDGETSPTAANPAPAAPPTPCVAELLTAARCAGVDRLDAQLLLGRVLARPRSWLIAHGEHALTTAQADTMARLLVLRSQGVPLAYLLGEREFHGLTLKVTPDVLVPRPDTEVLVDWALELLHDRSRGPVSGTSSGSAEVADLGTGSGAIALALKHRSPQTRLTAVDLSAAALDVARDNGLRLGLVVEWIQGDWFGPLAGRRFDLIVSNPPYIAAADPHLAALHAEPQAALTPGADGLGALRLLCQDAPAHLRPGAWLLLEHGFDQGAAVRRLLQDAGLGRVTTRVDLAGNERCSAGHWPRD